MRCASSSVAPRPPAGSPEMSAPLYSIPGATAPPAAAPADRAAVAVQNATDARTVNDVLAQSQVGAVMDELERDLVGLEPVKSRIRDISALLVIDKLRMNLGLQAQAPDIRASRVFQPAAAQKPV